MNFKSIIGTTALATVGGFVTQVIAMALAGLIIVGLSGTNDEVRMTGAYLIAFSPFVAVIPRLILAGIIGVACALIAPTMRKAALGWFIINTGLSSLVALFALGLFGGAL